MLKIHVYGKLRRHVKEFAKLQGNVIEIAPQPEETIEAILARIGIPLDDIYTIFLNSRLLASRSKMAYWMRYQQVHENPLEWKLDVTVRDGDRIGLFGRDMAALVV